MVFTKLFLLSVDYHTLNILVRELYGQEIINYYRAVSKHCWNVIVSQGINQSGAVWEK